MERIDALRRRVPVWAKLALAGLLLAGVLCSVYIALGRPALSPEGAAEAAERSLVYGAGETAAQGSLEAYSAFPPDHWLVRRYGQGDYALYELERMGPLWRAENAWPIALTGDEPLFCWSWLMEAVWPADFYSDYYEPGIEASKHFFLAACPALEAAEVAVLACWVPDALAGRALTREERLDYLEAHGAEIALTQTAPGSGIWTALGGVPLNREECESHSLFCRFTARDKQGNVLAQAGAGVGDTPA